ncbi:DUF6313 family protein [Micromonospora sp. WMMA1949]|uniref:DUF6313 family protein n=1 Tax=Micromonospora sp. WMMA1949 TaxID=3015162 RepID=UPI003FA5FBCB
MPDLIPRLQDLVFAKGDFAVREGFAASFVKLHAENWRQAQDHWERIVAQVLDSTAVEKEASGSRAIRQAVLGAVAVLDQPPLRNRCPICVSARPESRLRWRERSRV